MVVVVVVVYEASQVAAGEQDGNSKTHCEYDKRSKCMDFTGLICSIKRVNVVAEAMHTRYFQQFQTQGR